ncbi:MAG: pyridoxine 5'-phosphate synthase [Gemmataceae bacterium]|nr:pyridoxine 5'-phosphate synthase [Gemmataceae bacterium]
MIRLGVNLDHIATVRQARREREPDPVAAATLAVLGGADNITVHLREDRRHIQERDVRLLRQTLTRTLNLEMAVNDEIVALACEIKPEQATLVPERREELTTEGGLDVVTHQKAVAAAMDQLKAAGIQVALFIDPDLRQIEIAKVLGAPAIEIQTARYSEAKAPADRQRELSLLRESTDYARTHGMHVHMGHGLDYVNVAEVARIPGVDEFNIGFSIVSRALFVGLERAVREMKDAMRLAQASARGM